MLYINYHTNWKPPPSTIMQLRKGFKVMTGLLAISPKKVKPSKPKILIYGKSGVGKTWVSLEFPNVYYIDTEGGADLEHYMDILKKSNGDYLGKDRGSLDFGTIIGQVKKLATVKHRYKTLVIDSITKIFNLEIVKESDRLKDAGLKNAFGADRKPAVAFMRQLISWLQKIDMNVILIAHEKAEYINEMQVGTTFDCWDKLEYELHLCLNIIKAGDRNLYKVRKTRLLGFPGASTSEWTYENFAKNYGKDIMEKPATQLLLATKEQLDEIKCLLDSVGLPESWIEKCLKKIDASTIEEMQESDLQKTIDFIKSKYLPK